VLLFADGLAGGEVAAMVGCSEQTVVAWRNRYANQGLSASIVCGVDGRARLMRTSGHRSW
jgi:transposase